ncbi:hypothetical protein BDB00DRAFT_815973, partial [Zychaea mexicana]|uniref:uncharacterized protein n=1 Tax=Zychaea mexicana TaxID=64656 RepID=UPI0022FF2C55
WLQCFLLLITVFSGYSLLHQHLPVCIRNKPVIYIYAFTSAVYERTLITINSSIVNEVVKRSWCMDILRFFMWYQFNTINATCFLIYFQNPSIKLLK